MRHFAITSSIVTLAVLGGNTLGAAGSAVTQVHGSRSIIASHPVKASNDAQSSSVTLYYSWGSDKTFRLEAKSNVGGAVSLKPGALSADGAKLASSWQCAYVFDNGFSDDEACTQSGVSAATTIQGSGTAAVTGAFGTAGNNASGSFSFTCRQLSSKGCSGTVELKFPKLAP